MSSLNQPPVPLTIDTYETITDDHQRLSVHAYVRVSPTSPEVCIALLAPSMKLTLDLAAAVELARQLELCVEEHLPF
jgi:hypothetical protein